MLFPHGTETIKWTSNMLKDVNKLFTNLNTHCTQERLVYFERFQNLFFNKEYNKA